MDKNVRHIIAGISYLSLRSWIFSIPSYIGPFLCLKNQRTEEQKWHIPTCNTFFYKGMSKPLEMVFSNIPYNICSCPCSKEIIEDFSHYLFYCLHFSTWKILEPLLIWKSFRPDSLEIECLMKADKETRLWRLASCVHQAAAKQSNGFYQKFLSFLHCFICYNNKRFNACIDFCIF